MAVSKLDFKVEMDSAALTRAFSLAPVTTKIALQDWVSRSTLRAERAEKSRFVEMVSANSSGRTITSIKSHIGVLEGEAKSDTEYNYWVVHGRKPGKMPPFQEGSDLAAWARRAGVDPFLVARSIAKNGTKGIPYVEAAYKDIKDPVYVDGRKVLSTIIGSLT